VDLRVYKRLGELLGNPHDSVLAWNCYDCIIGPWLLA